MVFSQNVLLGVFQYSSTRETCFYLAACESSVGLRNTLIARARAHMLTARSAYCCPLRLTSSTRQPVSAVDPQKEDTHTRTHAHNTPLLMISTAQVFTAAMSASPGQHHLIAVGSDSPQARLCDIRSGAFAHALSGHSEAVWACAWSPRSEFLLATGSADQTVRRMRVCSLVPHRDELVPSW